MNFKFGTTNLKKKKKFKKKVPNTTHLWKVLPSSAKKSPTLVVFSSGRMIESLNIEFVLIRLSLHRENIDNNSTTRDKNKIGKGRQKSESEIYQNIK
mmetsp:Transcript_41361/g.53379  ORF Transcript_41361/g.53379 Transcript_41361/m.53379 type:complete len:97 (+) Transcript_41361:1456-1746(+)